MRVFQTGLEMGSAEVFPTRVGSPGVSSGTTRGAWSAYSLELDNGETVSTPLSNLTEVYARYGFRAAGGQPIERFSHFKQGGNPQVFFHWENGVIRAYRGDWSSPTLLGTATHAAVGQNQWVLIEVHVVFSNTVGVVQVRVDGTLCLDLSGIDTVHTANAWTDAMSLECQTSSRDPFYYDDIAINDTSGTRNKSWIGDGKISAIVPNAVGSETDFTRAGADSGANWSQVEERPPNDATDYVESGTVGARDLYEMSTTTFDTRINAITTWSRTKKSDAGTAALRHVISADGSEDTGTSHTLTTSWAYYGDIFELDPGSSPWTQATLDGIESGFEVE